jgi:hypothetical protein
MLHADYLVKFDSHSIKRIPYIWLANDLYPKQDVTFLPRRQYQCSKHERQLGDGHALQRWRARI